MRLSLVLFLLCTSALYAQTTTHFTSGYSAELGAFVSSTKRMPFWLRANQYGIVPLTAPGGTIRLGAHGKWQPDSTAKRNRWFVQYGAYAAGNVAKTSQVVLPEAYAMAGVGKFYVYAGRRREIIGLGDSTLSSGFYSWSQNAIPIPKVQIGTNGFVPLGFTKSVVAFNFLYAHGWFPNTDSVQGSYLHQKALFLRIGRPSWKVKLYGGIIHNVQWGGGSDYLRSSLTINGKFPSSYRDYLDLIVARPPRNRQANYTGIDSNNQVGNHLGSIDFGAELTLSNWRLLAYYQHPFEDKSGLAFINSFDGLYGIRLKNEKDRNRHAFRMNQLTFEYLNTVAGTKTPDNLIEKYKPDTYFNHSQYIDGWTTGQRVIGTPFITRWKDMRSEITGPPRRLTRMITNNIVKVVHVAVAGEFASGIQVDTRISFSQNYGPFTNPVLKGAQLNQFSGVLRASIPLPWLGRSELQTAISLDKGQLYDNAVGGYLGLRKIW